MARIERSSRAENDAIEIWAFVASDSPRHADELIEALDQRLEQLGSFPLSGEVAHAVGSDGNVRRSSVGSYVIYYHPLEDGIQLIRILHGARQPENLLES